MKKHEAIIAYIVKHFRESGVVKTKLLKLLWFAHREFMYAYSKNLSELKFIKLPHGPVPKIKEAQKTLDHEKILSKMIDDGILKLENRNGYDYFLCNIDIDVDKFFEPSEICILDETLYELKNLSATKLSELSHDSQWNALNIGDTMLVESVFLRDVVEIPESELETLRAKYL